MQKSRVRAASALLVGLSVVATACGSDSATTDTTASGSGDTMAETTAGDTMAETTAGDTMAETTAGDTMAETTAGDSMAETTAAAPVEVGSAKDGVLTLGGLLPETGNLAFLGPPEFAGVELAVKEINDGGGVLDKPVVWEAGDSGDNGEVANATVDRLLAKKVDAFIGAASSSVSLTVIDKITTAGRIQFSPANTSPTFTTYDDNGLYFRTAPSDVIQGAALAQTLIDDGVQNVAFLVLNDAYGTGLLEYTKGPYEEAGGTVAFEKIYDPKAENFDAEVNELVAATPDGVVIIGFDETSKILSGLIENGYGPADKPVYGTDGNMGNALAEAFDDPSVLAGMKGTLPGVDVGTMEDFKGKLLEVDPSLVDFSYSAEAYDATIVTALAALVAGDDDGSAVGAQINGVTKDGEKCTNFADCKALVDAGTDIDYDGVSGPLEFSDAGEPTKASILILEFDDAGALQTIGSIEGSSS